MSNKNSKNTKSKNAPAVNRASKSAPKTSVNFGARLSKSRGRIVGVTTISGNKVRKLNGQVKNVSESYATIFDRNMKSNVKFALSSILTVTGA